MSSYSRGVSKFVRVAGLVEQLSATVEASRLKKAQADALIAQIDEMVAVLDARRGDGDARVLADALLTLRHSLAEVGKRGRERRVDAAAGRRLGRNLRRIALLLTAGAALAAPMAAAAGAPDPVSPSAAAGLPTGPQAVIVPVPVGGTILNPVTNANETVVEVLGPAAVRTNLNNVILLAQTVGDIFPNPAGGNWTVTAVTTDGDGHVVSITVKDASNVSSSLTRVSAITTAPSAPPGGSIVLPAAAGDIGYQHDIRRGDGGGGGSDGALFVSAGSGGAGQAGPNFDVTAGASNQAVTTVSDNVAGVMGVSIGGNGGNGGDGYLGASGASGGSGGAGGNVTVTSNFGTISTNGVGSHGVVAQSRAGIGGEGGSGFVFSSGGSGGSGSTGGTATAINHSTITTRGASAHGVFAQSLGGGAGSGGGSYGLFGDGGAGNRGGHGGHAEAINYATVTTLGNGSFGVSAQSLGGIGGDAGTAVGLVTFSDDGAPGGNGGTAVVRARAGSEVYTSGAAAHGLFAQSIGGGGGNGGLSLGLASLGSGGGTGGNGGRAEIEALDGTFVSTSGVSSHGLFAQSIGGGGGNGGVSGGVVAIGSRGSSGGTGGQVVVNSGSTIQTTGAGSRGLFAQSIGGGGGNALGSGGLVSLGGSGGGAGTAGEVQVTTSGASAISTLGLGADGIFAQSVGGGGGSGSASGGVVALGGGGGAGGNGNTVTVDNSGTVTTQGDFARGVFAQSVGGGGGTGGDSGGLVTLGGNGSGLSTGGAVTVTNRGAVSTAGDIASALQVQSIGGGGGDGGSSGGVFLTIGGAGGGGGGSGVVTVNNSGDLTTGGNDSHGIFAQSVGGGGGNGGSTVSVSAFAGAAVGGSGGSGGAGGTVDVNLSDRTQVVGGVPQTFTPLIVTTGDRSRGVFAQSVGGGGGNGGFAAQVSAGYGVSASVAIGGSGGLGGVGGEVQLDGDATIFTSGDYAEGLFAQSVGGGGGNGGFAMSFSFAAGETAAAAFGVGVGGSGGSGGAGGLVSVHSGGAIQTSGDFSTGFLTQSVGGGGGNGGFSVAFAGSGAGVASASVAASVGGSGGSGGIGGQVDGHFDGTILTTGDDARAALIQSVGGGGGNGGFSVSGAVSVSGTVGAGASVGVGGFGGGGGAGGDVTGSVGGAVQTEGDRSTAVTVQSIGGGGGSGGFNVAGSIGGGGTVGAGLAVGVGGSGGGGGAGGSANGTSGGTILTLGNQSGGLLVQSVGGGGGSGGFNVSGSIGGAGTVGGALSVGVGGAGGSGGAGGAVTGAAQGAVETRGDQSAGVTIQSVGGGGGSGAFNVAGGIGGGGTVGAALSVGVGGAGGGGGDGGSVIGSSVSVLTWGEQSAGFLAQSVGGGGGNGGFNVAGSIGGGQTAGVGLSVGVGGSGGTGGAGGAVQATITGDVTTRGGESDAVTAQSVGGGGGNGGFNVSGSITGAQTGAASLAAGVGGSGGGGGSAGAVGLTMTGRAQTTGAYSDAVIAQSVGGGGGNGGFNVTGNMAFAQSGAGTLGVGVGGMGGGGGDGAAVTLNLNTGVADPGDTLVAAVTTGANARGVLAQSVGGGGGNGGFTITGGLSGAQSAAGNVGFGVGGGGGGGGNAAAVIGNINGDVGTSGADSSAVLIQSVGGGGGNGGFNISGGITGSQSAAGNLMVGVGGFGGAGGDAGPVSGTLTGDVATVGNRSFGVSYQSLGGGGGNGAFNITGGVALAASGGGAGNIGVGVGGFGGDGGDASTVNATVTGDISTGGSDAWGALLQSVGGGGGAGGFNITGGLSASTSMSGTLGFGLGGFGGGGGDAGDVTGFLTGDVQTLGDGSFGTMLQSLGGAGGNGGFNVTGALSLSVNSNPAVAVGIGIGGFGGGGGDAGAVNGAVVGDYITRGANADGVVAQSLGGGGGNGGLNVTGNVALSSGTAGTVGIGIGGFGGAGGDSGAVTFAYTGDIDTDGANSDGLIVQSLAGGGGNGAINVTGGIAASTSGTAGGLSFGLGGFGGGGGDAADVSATVTGNVRARGLGNDEVIPAETTIGGLPGTWDDTYIPPHRIREDGSNGVVVQSIGGGGGNGGLNVSGQISLTPPGTQAARSVTLGVGGFGGAGGDAGNVTLNLGSPDASQVQISAIGDNRSAVIVQSVGGGGGAGGINVSGGVAMDGVLTAGIGGFGGGGGLGRDVVANVDADLFAAGSLSRGLMVQSIGGGGGAGAINISGGLSADPAGTEPSLTFGLGGFGGAGNRSGDVTANQSGQVVVEGAGAIGVLVQSVAGGGGSGGLNVTADIHLGEGGSSARTQGVAIGVGIGGTGGDGADAGEVSLRSVGNIFMNARPVASPPPGGDAFEAIDFAADAPGVLAQSVGGGGGVGGVNVTGVVAPFGQPAAIGVGGSGGSGGNAGTVSVVRGYAGSGAGETEAAGLIRTFGDHSDGLVAQSVGGGGGRAGVNAVFGLTTHSPGNNPIAAMIAVGGSGAGAGSGDDVSVRHLGDIQTAGTDSDGIFAQSVGGGGGDANYNIGFGVLRNATALNLAVGGATGAGGTGGNVTVRHEGVIVTAGRDSSGIHAQSVGGGGGDTVLDLAMGILANNSLDITIGRQGGTGGSAGDVTVVADGTIQTSGENADGVLAQSIGGGGGASSATTVGVTGTSGANTPQAESYSVGVSVGLDGGVGAFAGDVDVDVSGSIRTAGYEARGVFAQSIGGGGGRGGSAANTIVRSAGAATVAVGGTGGTGAVSGDVSVSSDATIVTTGHRADGILAQAIGGGGGMGGVARTLAFQVGGPPPTTTTRTLSVSVGGSGGAGAVGGAVDVSNFGVIATGGEYSHGIRAQSIGGGGGVGGMVLNAALQYRGSDDIDLNIGGAGGTGGAGGSVSVLNEGLIFTEGRFATGISANSIGGGGGDAGLVLDVQLGYAGTDAQTHRFVANIGGSGGDGGVGGAVSVINRPIAGDDHTGEIVTRGEGAYGIFAQSLGGGGGNGSSVLSLTGMITGRDSFIFGLNIGGSGGTGNTGGTVDVLNAGLIDTTGAGAHGILAQSIGGGGGNGGAAFAANVMIAPTTQILTHAPLVTVGGFGGDGGDAGAVTVTNTGAIVTRGANAHGILAQSIGGGGGNAQMGFGLTSDVGSMILSHAVSALVGNFGGGSGGVGGPVTVNHSGDITVLGEGSQAIIAQSINGGGGSLTFDFSGIVGLPGAPFVDIHGNTVTPDPMVLARAGAENAVNMSSGDVTVTSTGTFQVGGRNGVGNLTQAIGGGGGSVIMKATISPLAPPPAPAPAVIPALAADKAADGPEVSPMAAPGEGPAAAPGDPIAIPFAIALGGTNGVGNNGGVIDSQHTGSILTTGLNSPAVVLQSVGGGGGLGLLDLTIPDGALIGALSATLGGVNGTDEAGGPVSRVNTGDVTTGGDLSHAVVLQSIGGGGGSVSVVLTGGGAANAALDATLGSDGGSNLHGGAIVGEFSGDIRTYGDHAVGLMAQSIGGGGGELRLSGVSSADVTLGGAAGANGDGGSIELENNGLIVTQGDRSHGVLLQSIGGGGGAVFGDFAANVTLSGVNMGSGGNITFTQSGDILTFGAGSYGVIAQSLGGGGGWVDGVFAGTAGGIGLSGTIDLNLSGAVFAAGVDSTAIFAQSDASFVSGGISITTDNLVRGGSGSGAGVRMDGPADNRLHITAGSVSAVSGLAIDTTSGNDTVDNEALVVGNIDLGNGDNAFNNRLGSTFVAFNTIDLRDWSGASGVFTNAGDFDMGLSASRTPIDLAAGETFGNLDALGDPTTNLMYGARVINTVALDGDFVQTAAGHLDFDIAFGPYASDRVNVTGDAFVDGTGDIVLTWLENDEEVTLFATGGVGVDNGLEITDTLAMDYSVRGDADGVHLSFVSDFGQPFLNRNGRQLGSHMDFAIRAGDSGGIGQLMALIGNLQVGEEDAYAQIFEELNPEPLMAPLVTQLAAAEDFSDQLFSCASPAFKARERCVWARIEGSSYEREGDFEHFRMDAQETRLRAGFERPVAETWSFAGAIGFDRVNEMDVGGRARADGKGIHGSVGLQRTGFDGLQFGTALSGGMQWMETARAVDVFQPLIGTSESDSAYVQASAHLAYVGRSGSLFVRPALNVSATALTQANFSEEGLDGLGVEALEETQVFGTLNPELGLGAVLSDTEAAQATLLFTAGGVFRSEDEIRMPYRLRGSNPDAIPALIGTGLDSEAWRLGADLRVATRAGVELRFTYEAEFGDKADNRTAGLNLRMTF
ncbi:autotransporter outer membrane beta-barrel domain-containing protein [Brevundimonas sp.]|uniref:autotransporter outer membrane beta-barrel domain-containing protein n=1 Tax=Brevundimonas sp. TaxID=1871086 RepID=UPI002D53FFA6|nr:autotransporter outer membrane beta-barrel domain-containing protein [Brevundimonas sp.]HYC98208.1 autotransporter outer membrane beta-barrel domain-containing protein [Brevundimonas sp.]